MSFKQSLTQPVRRHERAGRKLPSTLYIGLLAIACAISACSEEDDGPSADILNEDMAGVMGAISPVEDETSAAGEAVPSSVSLPGGTDSESQPQIGGMVMNMAASGGMMTVDTARASPDSADEEDSPSESLNTLCPARFEFESTTASRVEVAGEWAWESPEALVQDGTTWRLEKALPAGVHCYKFIIDGEWARDPANPYEKYCGGVRNSGIRVADCQAPSLSLTSFVVEGAVATALFQVSAGVGNDEQPMVSAGDAEVNIDENGSGTAIWRNLEQGKHTLKIQATDNAGRSADLLLPFWIESEPFEWRDALIYLVMTDRFVNGDPSNDAPPQPDMPPSADWMGGDLAGLLARLEDGYLESLGVSAIWLTPPQENPDHGEVERGRGSMGYHGYWPVKARTVDARFGSADELKAVIQAAHERGIRVLMDFVANHVHDDHEYYAQYPQWFNDGCECGMSGCGWTEYALVCLFQPYMPDLDWTNADAAERLVEDALWWLETFDLDGLRVDAVKHVPEIAVYNLATRVRERFEAAGQDIYLVGETAVGWAGDNLAANDSEYGLVNSYMGPTGLDGQFDFVLYHAVVNNVFFRDQKGFIHLDAWTRFSVENYLEGAVMVPYIGSHDTSRALSMADYRGQDSAHPDSTVWNKWPDEGLPEEPNEDEPYARVRTAFCWLLTSPGAPLIYMGDEYGEFGGADPDNRHPHRNQASLSVREANLLSDVQALGLTRKALPALRRGDYQSLASTETMAAYSRTTTEGELAVVFVNGADTVQTITREVGPACSGECWTEVTGLGAVAEGDGRRISATIPPRSCGVFVPSTVGVESQP